MDSPRHPFLVVDSAASHGGLVACRGAALAGLSAADSRLAGGRGHIGRRDTGRATAAPLRRRPHRNPGRGHIRQRRGDRPGQRSDNRWPNAHPQRRGSSPKSPCRQAVGVLVDVGV